MSYFSLQQVLSDVTGWWTETPNRIDIEVKKVKLDKDDDPEYKNQITKFIDDRVYDGRTKALEDIPQYISTIKIRESANPEKVDNFSSVLREIANADDDMAAKLKIHRNLDSTTRLDFDKKYSVDTVKDEIKKQRANKGGRKLSRHRKSKPKSNSKHYNKKRSYKKSSYRRRRH